MLKGEFADMLINQVKEYYKNGVIESITRNKHMNKYREGDINTQDEFIKAVLVDFVNYLCTKQFIDLALYTKDLDNKI